MFRRFLAAIATLVPERVRRFFHERFSDASPAERAGYLVWVGIGMRRRRRDFFLACSVMTIPGYSSARGRPWRAAGRGGGCDDPRHGVRWVPTTCRRKRACAVWDYT